MRHLRRHRHPAAPVGLVLALLAWSLFAVQPCSVAFALDDPHPHATHHAQPDTGMHADSSHPANHARHGDAVHGDCPGLPHDVAHCLSDGEHGSVALASAAEAKPFQAEAVLPAAVIPVLQAARFRVIPPAPARASPLNLQYLFTQRLRL